MPLQDIDAICIDTRDVNLAVAAAARMREAGVGNIKILTDEDGITIARRADFNATAIQKLETIDAYSKFMIEQIHEHVTSDNFLVFQWDGFIINPHLWWDGFLEYDYIGAPWPQPYRPAPGLKVGNGGFSLRSRSLSAAMGSLGASSTGVPEDVYIAQQLISNQELAEFRPASVEIARHFSVEHQTYLTAESPQYAMPGTGTFGFHGWFNFHIAFDDRMLVNYIQETMTSSQRHRILGSWANTALLVNLFNTGRQVGAQLIAEITAHELNLATDPKSDHFVQEVINGIQAVNSEKSY